MPCKGCNGNHCPICVNPKHEDGGLFVGMIAFILIFMGVVALVLL